MQLLAQATEIAPYAKWMPPMLSEHGGQIDNLISILHYFMAILFVAWGIFLTYTVVRFRARAGHKAEYHPVKGKASKYAEIGIAMFEAFLLLGLSMPVWAEYKNNPPKAEERVEVRAIGEQFQWNFHYPGPDGVFGRTNAKFIDAATNTIGLDPDDPAGNDDLQTIGEMHLPVGKPIYVRVSSKDVIHSFAIPTMRVKQDCIPGMEIPIWFTVKEDATTERVKKEMVEEFQVADVNWYRLRHHISMEDYADESGQIILKKGEGLGLSRDAGEKKLKTLGDVTDTIKMQPRNPLEIICAQLCGNSHFKMKAQVFTYDDAGYQEWMDNAAPKEVDIDFDDF